MPFDLSTAKPIQSSGGFDLNSAKPVNLDNGYEGLYQKYVKDYNDTKNQVPIPGTPPVDQGPLLSKEEWRARNDKRFRDNILSVPLAAAEQGINLLGGAGAAVVAPIGAGIKALNDVSQGRPTSFEQDYADLFGKGSSLGTQLADLTGVHTGAREAITEGVGNVMNRVGIPMAGLNLPHINKNAELRRAMPEAFVPEDIPKTNEILDNLKKQTEQPKFDINTAKPVDQELPATTAMSPSQLKEWADIQEKYAAYKRGELPEQKQAAAQAAIDARQKALEQDVARQGGLDFNAAERARQEAAPTGYADWAEKQRQKANTRLPGDNTPMDLGPNRLTRAGQYPDINDYPGLLQDAPYQYEGGIDYTPPRDRAALPVEVADILRTGDKVPDPFARISYGQNAKRMAAPLEEHIANLNRSEGQPNALSRFEGEGNVPRTPKASVTPPDHTIGRWEGEGGRSATNNGRRGGKQSGAIDPDVLINGVERLFHGGRKFGTWDPKTVGSGEGMGVMGPGLYAGNKQELAHQYLKYGGSEARLSDMAVDTSRILETAKKFSPEMRDAYDKATAALDALGLRATQRGVKSAMAQAPRHLHEAARNALVKAGIDGFKENLGAWGHEYVIFNPDVIKQISDATGPVEKYTGKFNSQSGKVDIKGIADEVRKQWNKAHEFGAKLAEALTPQERVVLKNVGDHSYIPLGESPEKIIAAAKGQPDVPLNTLFQSGLGGAALKTGSAVHQGVNRWLQWATKVAAKDVREQVKPVEVSMSALTRKEFDAVHGILRKEMFDRQTYTPAQLSAAGLSDKGIKAYNTLRNAFNDVWERTNASRAKLGLDPITKQSAYYSSMWNGNYHMPVYDKSGKISWYVKTETMAEAKKAMQWIKDNHPDVDASRLKIEYKPENIGSRLPRDVTSTFEAMMKIFEDTPMAQQMKELLDQYRTEQAYTERGHYKHFEEKGNVRGFLGDRPWLSEREQAAQGMKAQVQYLKDAYHWAPLQEAMANIRDVLSDPDLVAQQPNNVKLAKLYTANAMGLSNSVTKGLESLAAQGLGKSPGTMGKFVGGLKNLTYLQQLGLSPGYMIATPLQAFILGPSRHLLLSKEGFKYNPLTTAAKAMYDSWAMLMAHEGYNISGSDMMRDKLVTPLGKQALRYMEDNGIINISMFDEHGNLGEGRITNTLKNTVGATISVPEKVARVTTFMSFVHHLEEGGMKAGTEMFQRAEELTNATLTEFHKNARPLIVDKLGLTGELLYTYKSPMFNFYNSLFEFAKHAKQTGDIRPFAMAIIMSGALGGMFDVPGVQELDGTINLFKGFIAKHKPDWYNSIRDIGVKEFALKHLPDWATYGTVSKALGAQMSSRFSNQVIDPENPLGNVAPVAQEIKEQAAIASSMINPNITNFQEGLWQNSPPMVKGMMETGLDNFKSEHRGDTQTYYNPNRLGERQAYVNRTPADETYRKLGLTSLPEARQRDVRYANNQESKRLETARDSSITKMFDAVVRKDQGDIQKYAISYFMNDGDMEDFQRQLAAKIMGSALTPEEKQVVYAKTLSDAKNLYRRMQMDQTAK